ncbi:MAG: penicillin acylase family protein [Chitinophagaceae bacterium]|nr:MAG: penicillin acylase family protein [Chitinophagaceae bacterium]
MRTRGAILFTIITIALIVLLDNSWSGIPALGKFLSPHHGFWRNAEPVNTDHSASLSFPELSAESSVYFDERLVPHVFAGNDNDLYFIQGFIHAKFRLWQMEMQTYAAAGRVSEVVGLRTLQFDRQQRRLGMVYAASKMVEVLEKNPVSKTACDQYTAGINAYINSLSDRDLPLEYKLLGFKPEPWTNLKVALFVKQMAKTLASNENDLAYSYAKNFFNEAQMQVLFPHIEDSLDPVIPAGTSFEPATIKPVAPANVDSAYLNNYNIIPLTETDKPSRFNGSNNWAVSGSKTKSGKPILANDPHLDLTLPSVWFEMQLTSPGMNVYGVSFPGCPGIIIGFNNEVAWGVTNAGRDVRDYYEIKFRDSSKTHYWFNNTWRPVDSLKVETFRIKGADEYRDTVAYIDQGPVMFDNRFESRITNGRAYAVRWIAHDAGNELLAFYHLNRAKNYSDYLAAIKHYVSPAQNFVFASASGDIALWQQGKFPARWPQQGLYIMPYKDSSYVWQGYIPQEHNPHMLNPSRNFVSSANQRSVAADYPYFIPGDYDLYRGKRINSRLSQMQSITTDDMTGLQKDNYNGLAATVLPLMLHHVQKGGLSATEKLYTDTMQYWNYNNVPELVAPTLFKIWYDSLESYIWTDELAPVRLAGLMPDEKTLAEALLRDTSFQYINNQQTAARETLSDAVTVSLKRAVQTVQQLAKNSYQSWGIYKNTTIYHLLGQDLTAFARQGLTIGGGKHVVNATQHNHGPSWKMVVELTSPVTARVVYPGGQSGNPGSKHYDDFVDDYAAGKYYDAWFLNEPPEDNKRVKSVIRFSKN